MQFDGIVKNRRKIESTIRNAHLFRTVQKEFGSFYAYLSSFFSSKTPLVHHFKTLEEVPTTSPEALAISKDMQKRGFRFFGPVICYAFLQATGFVNDHLEGCLCRKNTAEENDE